MDEHMTVTEDDYDDLEYNDEFESVLQAAESQVGIPITSIIAPPYTDQATQPGTSTSARLNNDAQPVATQLEEESEMVFETGVGELIDVEETPVLSPFERFRQHGNLSVSDLVGTVWCEVQEENDKSVQYDYRLRTLPYLPPSKRPAVITSDKGKEIVVDKTKEEGRERIVRRGETLDDVFQEGKKIHKRLEREIHPEEVIVTTDSREDVWGLRFLNMLAAMEALITLGTCRELPVVGFVGGILVTGIIDELNRRPIDRSTQTQTPQTRSSRQTALTSFFSPTKPRPPSTEPKARTHKVYVSDSKTRARDSLPRETDTLAGQLQCMMYKELLDAMFLAKSSDHEGFHTASAEKNGGISKDLEDAAMGFEGSTSSRSLRPSAKSLSFETLFQHLALDPFAPFSEHFIAQTRPIIMGNGLRLGAAEARNLTDMVLAWERYVADLGLGSPGSRIPPSSSQSKSKGKEKAKPVLDENAGKTEMRLELVYRRAGRKKVAGKKKGRKGRRRKKGHEDIVGASEDDAMEEAEVEEVEETMDLDNTQGNQAREEEEERLLQMVIKESLKGDTIPNQGLQEEDDPSGPTLRADPDVATPSGVTMPDPAADPGSTLKSIKMEDIPQQSADNLRPTSRLSEYHIDRTSDEEREEDEVAWAVEMSLADAQEDDMPGEIAVPTSQRSAPSSPVKQTTNDSSTPAEETRSTHSRSSSSSPTPPLGTSTASGSIIGRHRFKHDIPLLDRHLESVLQYWRGEREPVGVSLMETRRCGWCEFEEGCEWRSKKAQEEWDRSRSSRKV